MHITPFLSASQKLSLTVLKISVRFFVVIALRTLHMWLVPGNSYFEVYVLEVICLNLCLPSFFLFELQFQMREPKMCQIVCKLTVGEKEAKELKEKIEDEYRVNM
jgi:hypothetical protein